jgi:hypothetical protein
MDMDNAKRFYFPVIDGKHALPPPPSRELYPIGHSQPILNETVAATDEYASAHPKQSAKPPNMAAIDALDYPLWHVETIVSDEKAAASSALLSGNNSAAMAAAAKDAFYVDRDWRLLAPTSPNVQLGVAQGILVVATRGDSARCFCTKIAR